jgi:hypothetical protein
MKLGLAIGYSGAHLEVPIALVQHCVKDLTSFVREYGITDLVTWAVPPGMRPEQMNGSLERFVRDVAPRVKAAAAAA